VVIGSDEITPVVRAKVIGDYLVLSAEQSEGRGLLLDRAVWAFPGEGDSVSNSESYKTGTLSTETISGGVSTHGEAGVRTDFSTGDTGLFCSPYLDIGVKGYGGVENQIVNYGDNDSYRDHNDAFSTSNYHTGPICRRYVKGRKKQIVTLYVYRMTPEGGIEGKSITVNVNLKEAKSAADGGGVSYE
jgi:hypothetical protein